MTPDKMTAVSTEFYSHSRSRGYTASKPGNPPKSARWNSRTRRNLRRDGWDVQSIRLGSQTPESPAEFDARRQAFRLERSRAR